jgi:hypothetical protein
MNRRSLFILGALVVAHLAQPAEGQEGANLRGDSAQTRKRLAEAEQKLLAGKHADAADDLQRILDEAGDELVTVDGKQYRAARWIAHGILARLPESALKNYQDRIDEPARKLLTAAKRTNDPGPVWQLLDRYFVSRPADEGLLFLGDLLFERGEFRAAERTWRRLLPDGGADITYPGSRSDPAAVPATPVRAARSPGRLGHSRRPSRESSKTRRGFLHRRILVQAGRLSAAAPIDPDASRLDSRASGRQGRPGRRNSSPGNATTRRPSVHRNARHSAIQ